MRSRTSIGSVLSGALLGVTLLFAAAGGAQAVQPDEIMKDPALEARAREISRELRCPVCQNQSIDDSNAPLARDLRLRVRERLRMGESNAQVIAYIHGRYGDFVLLKPPLRPYTYLLWFGPPALLIIAVLALLMRFRRQRMLREAEQPEPLSADERARLAKLLDTSGRKERP